MMMIIHNKNHIYLVIIITNIYIITIYIYIILSIYTINLLILLELNS